jgi:hypothetical protein
MSGVPENVCQKPFIASVTGTLQQLLKEQGLIWKHLQFPHNRPQLDIRKFGGGALTCCISLHSDLFLDGLAGQSTIDGIQQWWM